MLVQVQTEVQIQVVVVDLQVAYGSSVYYHYSHCCDDDDKDYWYHCHHRCSSSLSFSWSSPSSSSSSPLFLYFRVVRTVQQLALILISPMGLLCIAAVVNTYWQTPNAQWYAVLWQAIDEAKQMLFLLLVDQYLFYSWTYTLASFAFLPTWLLFWAVPFCDV